MLDLNELAAGGHPGITAEKGADLAQAGAVCLEERGHEQGVAMAVQGSVSASYRLTWTPADAQARRTWRDDTEATEHGAAGIAALLSIREIGYMVVMRSWKGTGFDYCLGDYDTVNVSAAERRTTDALAIILEDAGITVRARVEVSGIRDGDDQAVNQRMNEKLNQTSRSDNLRIPAYAIVVEFGRPLAVVRAK